MHILCEDTKVNPIEFCYKYENTIKELTERNYYKFAYKNLTFETSMPKKIESSDSMLKHGKAGAFFLAEEYNDDEDLDSYSDFFEEPINDWDNEDDMDFLENDAENEMLNELDWRKSTILIFFAFKIKIIKTINS